MIGTPMKLNILYIWLTAFASILNAQPKLSLDKNDIDLGIFYSGEIRHGSVHISNIGTDTLKIFSVRPQCGCTTVKQPKAYLLPNQSDVIELEFNSSGYNGQVHKLVTISTNDPAALSIEIKLHGEAREDLEQEDRNMWLGEINMDSTVSRTLIYRNKSAKPLTIQNVISSAPALHVRWTKTTLKPEDSISIIIDFKPIKTGFGTEYIWLETDSKHQPRIESRISYMGKK
jgi:hypothetical protein